MISFQCDLCHFRNIQGRDPIGSVTDDNLMTCIRRANLDAFWAREPGTVSANLYDARRSVTTQVDCLGITSGGFRPLGPFPLRDTCGMIPAATMLMRSLDAGRNDKTVQFGTIRKVRSTFTNLHNASVNGMGSSTLMGDGRKMHFTDSLTHSLWYDRFIQGCHKRMGDVIKPNLAVSVEVMQSLMHRWEKDWDSAVTIHDKLKVALLGSFCQLGFVGALRGEEIPRALLGGTRDAFATSGMHSSPHVVIELYGRFKGEGGLDRGHLLPLAATTKSGFQPRLWIGRVLDCYEELGVMSGYMFRKPNGEPQKQSYYEGPILDKLKDIQDEEPHLIPATVNVHEDYGTWRSFRRGSTTHASNQGVDTGVIKRNQRWRKVEQARGRDPSWDMMEHYTDVLQNLKGLLLYSLAM